GEGVVESLDRGLGGASGGGFGQGAACPAPERDQPADDRCASNGLDELAPGNGEIARLLAVRATPRVRSVHGCSLRGHASGVGSAGLLRSQIRSPTPPARTRTLGRTDQHDQVRSYPRSSRSEIGLSGETTSSSVAYELGASCFIRQLEAFLGSAIRYSGS